MEYIGSCRMRCQVNVYFVHQFFVLNYILEHILRALWIPQVSGKVTKHVREIVVFGASAMGPSILIFPRYDMSGHLCDKHSQKLLIQQIKFLKTQVVERIRSGVVMP